MGLYYWRDTPYEVDYILLHGPRTVAIEVKSGKKKRGVSGLEEFNGVFIPFGRWSLKKPFRITMKKVSRSTNSSPFQHVTGSTNHDFLRSTYLLRNNRS